MRIVHVTMSYIPGMSYQENCLPAEQHLLGNEVAIATSDRLPAFEGYERIRGARFPSRILGPGQTDDRGVSIHRLRCWELPSYGQVLMPGLQRTLRDLSPDVVHAHGAFAPTSLQTTLCSQRLGYRVFVDDHSREGNLVLDRVAKRFYVSSVRAACHLLAGRVDRFLPVTPAAGQILSDILGIPREATTPIPLGVDCTRFTKSREMRQVGLKELNLTEDDFAIVTSGKFTKSKDIEVLLAAVRRLVTGGSQVKVIIVGDGSTAYVASLDELVRRLGLGQYIVKVGFLPNERLPILYNAADLGVWPGDHTTTFLEAAATGLPVVVPSRDRAYETLFDRNALLVFERGQPDSLYARIATVIQDPEFSVSVGSRAAHIVGEELSWRRIAMDSLAIYEESCRNPSR